MRRRHFIALIGAFGCHRAVAQPARPHLVGFLSNGPPLADASEPLSAFIRGMAERNYLLGQTLLLERRAANGRNSDLPMLARELVKAKSAVLVTIGYPTTVAAKDTGLHSRSIGGGRPRCDRPRRQLS